jgi:hypothetical protein
VKRDFWAAENFWASMHCTSTLLDKIASRRRESKKKEYDVLHKEHGLLSVSYSKNENIDGITNLIGMKHFKAMAKIMMLDAYEYDFDNISSVNNGSTIVLNEKLEKLKSISLMHHTFGVVNELYKIITKKYGIYSDVFYIAALTHDYGKCDNLMQKYGVDVSLPHHKASSEYVKKVAAKVSSSVLITPQDSKLVGIVCDVLDAHHTPEDENMFHASKPTDENKTMHIAVIEKLKEADQNQRSVELEMLL